MNTITTYKLTTDLSIPGCPVQIGNDRYDGLDLNELYEELDCDLVTAVRSPAFPGLTLWCDDEALLKTEPELNLRASILAGQPVYGPVLVVSEDAQRHNRSWSPDNPLPFAPCELDSLAKQIVTTGKVTLRY